MSVRMSRMIRERRKWRHVPMFVEDIRLTDTKIHRAFTGYKLERR